MSSSEQGDSAKPASTAAGGDSNTQVGVIAGISVVGFLLLLWYFGFVLLLWLLLALAALAGVAFGIGAFAVEDKDTRHGLLFGAALCGLVAFGLWKWIDSRSIVIPSLPKVADAQRITSEYKDRVAHIQMGYESTESRFLWQETVTSDGSGSGILLANDRTRGVILTNRHVIDPMYTGNASNVNWLAVQAKLASESDWYPARIVAIHRSLDMALVVVERPFRSKGAVRVANHRLLQQVLA